MKVEVGDVEVVKEAQGEEEREALALEAALLRRLAHPGLVRLLMTEGEPPERLITCRLPGSGVPPAARTDPGATAAWGAAVATTLADLHDLRVAHGRLDDSHLLVDGWGRPVLCGLSRALCGDSFDPLPDLRALGLLLSDGLVPHLDRRDLATFERLCGRAAPRLLVPGGRGGPSARGLAGFLAAWSADGPPPVEPEAPGPEEVTTRQAAGTLAGRARPAPSGRRERATIGDLSRGRTVPFTVLAGFVAMLSTGLAVWAFAGRQPARAARGPAPATGPSSAVAGTASLDDGGIARLVLSGSSRPVTVVGGWDCGPVRPAVLDAASGSVWVFPGWPQPGQKLTGRLVARVAGGTGLAVQRTRAGCDDLLVVTAGRTWRPVAVPPT